jgi:hypothetical protein
MRLIFLLLLLLNVAFYAYTFVARQQAATESQTAQLQINSDQVRLLKSADGARGTTPQKPGPASGNAAAAPAACLEWGLFAGPDVARADAAIATLGLAPDRLQRSVVGAGGYWVYVPPLKTKAEVNRKIEELKTFGVTDLFVVQDPAPLRNAISLGIFKTEEGAQKFLEGLRGKGVRSAVAARRDNFLRQVAYFVREPTEQIVASLAELRREFPGTEIKAVACPAGEPAKN